MPGLLAPSVLRTASAPAPGFITCAISARFSDPRPLFGAFPSAQMVGLAASLVVAGSDLPGLAGLVGADGRPEALRYGTDSDGAARWVGSARSKPAHRLALEDEAAPLARGISRQPYTLSVSGGTLAVARSVKGGDGGRLGGDRHQGDIVGWSKRSRARMRRTLAELDYGPLVEACTASGRPPVMLTLTAPADWLAVFPDAPSFKRAFRRFESRWARAFGRPVWVWKMEFQARGAPHLHILTPVPSDVPAFRCGICGDTEKRCTSFRHWVSRAWAESVATQREWVRLRPDTGAEEYRKHLLAGTGIDRDRRNRGAQMIDPRRLATYFLKHGMGGAKEYQHEAPREWVPVHPVPTPDAPVVDVPDGETPALGLGRFWGYLGLERGAVLVPVSRSEYHYVNRTLRRLAVSKARAAGTRYWVGGGGQRETGRWVAFSDAPSVLAGLVRVMRSPAPEVHPLRGVLNARRALVSASG